MSMTRDTYAKEVIKVAEAVFKREEIAHCPHEDCNERLSVIRQNTFSTRSLFCPVHGHIFQEQEGQLLRKLDWEAAEERPKDEFSGFDWDDSEDEE